LRNYSDDFYKTMAHGSRSSAQHIVPLLLSRYTPNSIVDVGCGTGPFAHEFLRRGVIDVAGYEGIWMAELFTQLPKDYYIYQDLTKPFEVTRKYDLCLCLEVAEHLDEMHARQLIESITSLSDVIVFSAAIPMQGGNHHVNEQWPMYWANLFAERNFFLDWDPRMKIWEVSEIEGCYRQNLLVFSSKTEKREVNAISLVHPELWSQAMRIREVSLKHRLAKRLPKSFFLFRRYILKKIGKQIA
jgi:SAM-dependent methyltransferase